MKVSKSFTKAMEKQFPKGATVTPTKFERSAKDKEASRFGKEGSKKEVAADKKQRR